MNERRFIDMGSGRWCDTWDGNRLVSTADVSRMMGGDVQAGGYTETRSSTIEVKAEPAQRKIRRTEVPADVEQLPEDVRIISEERIGDQHRARAHEWLDELQVNGYFLESESGEHERRVAYVNEARTAKQLAAVMDDLPPVPSKKKYHGTMAPGHDDRDAGRWLKDNKRLVVGIISFPASVALAAISSLIFLSGHHTAGKWAAGVILILAALVWFCATIAYCAPPAAKS